MSIWLVAFDSKLTSTATPPPSRSHHLLHVCEPINVAYMMPQANIGYWNRLNGGNYGEIRSGLLLIKTSFYLLIIHNFIYNKCSSSQPKNASNVCCNNHLIVGWGVCEIWKKIFKFGKFQHKSCIFGDDDAIYDDIMQALVWRQDYLNVGPLCVQ